MRTIRDEDKDRYTGDRERYEPVRIPAVCLRQTDKAILVQAHGKQVWIPQSQVHDDSEVYQADHEGTLVIPRWLAKEKGLLDPKLDEQRIDATLDLFDEVTARGRR